VNIVSKNAANTGPCWVGIDVSKRKLDAAIWLGGKKFRSLTVDNEAAGFKVLLAWAKEEAVAGELRFCMESTGDYGVAAALYLSESGYWVSVVNPAKIKYFAVSLTRLNKTDKADAKLIAQYAAERVPDAWVLRDAGYRSLFRLNRRRQQLWELIGIERNRLECPEAIGELCVKSIKAILKVLRSELRQIDQLIAGAVQAHPELSSQAEIIKSTSILGMASIVTILSEMPTVESCASAKSYAAAAGGHSTLRESGSTLKSAPMSRGGRKLVRKVLFLPVLAGKNRVPELKSLYDRLRLRGRTHRQAMVACIRKLLMIVYGLLKHRKPYKSRVPEGAIATTT
jgi:transposase